MRPRPLFVIVAFSATAPACHSGKSNQSASASASVEPQAPPVTSSAASPVPEAPPTAFTAKLVRCGWGAVDAKAGPDAMPWAIALVDVELPAAVRGLRVTAMELASDHGIAAKMGERATLRVQEGALAFTFGAAGTRELGEALPAGTFRLRAAAALDRPKKRIAPNKPTTCSVVLTADADRTLVAKGNADPEWQNE